MKKVLFGVGLVLLIVLFILGWFGYRYLDGTFVVVHNATSETIPLVTVEGDIGPKSLLRDIKAGETRSLPLSGADAEIRLVVQKRSGLVIKSNGIYISSGLTVKGTILEAELTVSGGLTEDKVILEYVR